MNKLNFYLSSLFLLVSCSITDNHPNIVKSSNTNITIIDDTGSIRLQNESGNVKDDKGTHLLIENTIENSGITSGLYTSTGFGNKQSELTQARDNSLPLLNSDQLFERIIQKINNIQSLDELDIYLPSAKNLEGRENPKFLDLHKKQLILELYISRISDPEYGNTIKRMNDIIIAKEIWTPELRDLYNKVETLSGELSFIKTGDRTIQNNLQLAIIDYSKAISTFHSTPGFIQYSQEHMSEVASLQSELQKYYSPEIIQLQNQIHSLYEKIYVTAPKS